MRRFFVDYSLVLGSHVLRLAGLVASQAIIVRCIDRDALGHFSYWVGVCTLLGVVSDLGLGPTVAREVARARDQDEERSYAAAMCRELPLSLVVYLAAITSCIIASCTWISPQLLLPGIVAGLLGGGYALQVPLCDLLSGKKDLVGLAVMNAGPFALGCAGIAALQALSLLNLTTAVGCVALAHSLCCVLLLLRSGAAKRPEDAIRLSFRHARRRYGWGVSLGRIVGTGAFLLDMPILGLYWPASHLATYAAIKTIANPFAVAGNVLGRVLFKSLVAARRIPYHYTALTGAYAVLAGICVVSIASPALSLIYGLDAGPLRVAIAAQVIAVMAQIMYTLFNTCLRAHGHGRLLATGGIGFGMLCAATNLYLIPLRGAEGACMANAVCNLSWLMFCLIGSRMCARKTPCADEQQLPCDTCGQTDTPTERIAA